MMEQSANGGTLDTVELDRWLRGLVEDNEVARAALIERMQARLQLLARRIVRDSFPGLHGHEESVGQEATFRLWKALAEVHPPTKADLLRFAAHKIRQVLFDLVSKEARSSKALASQECQSTYDPSQLSLWTEFHERVESLPAEQRTVFDLRYYDGLSNAEIAAVLGLTAKAVSRLWLSATEQLLDSVPGLSLN